MSTAYDRAVIGYSWIPQSRGGRGRRGLRDVERAETFKRRYLGGETLQAIAADYGVSRERVRQVLRKAGVPSLGLRPEHCRKRHDLTPTEIEAARLYDEGTPPREITARTGLPYAQIRDAVRRTGRVVKGTSFWRTNPNDAEITAKVAELYQAGVRAVDIVKQVPELLFTEKVYYYLGKAGVKARRSRPRKGYWSSTKEAGAERREQVARLHAQGLTSREIAEATGLFVGTVYLHLSTLGLKSNRPKKQRKTGRVRKVKSVRLIRERLPAPSGPERPWTDNELGCLVRRWLAGDSASDIGRELGRSRNSVLGKVFRLGLTRNQANAPESLPA